MKHPRPVRQRGIAALLFILLACLGLLTATAGVLYSAKGAQKLQFTEHTAVQAQMNAWTGVNAISGVLAAQTSAPTMTAGSAVQFAGLPSTVSAKYVGQQSGYYVFDVTGASAGTTATLRAAYVVSIPGPGSAASSPGTGLVLHGDTTLSGGTTYSGTGSFSLVVYGGALNISGGTNGLDQVCATGDVTLSAAVQVNKLCSGGNVSMSGAAAVGTSTKPSSLSAVGYVTMSGGAGVYGDISSNSYVSMSGTAIPTTAVNATGDVTVPNSSSATSISTQGNINWTSSSKVATSLVANGNIVYKPSGSTATTAITAIGNVTLTDAGSVTTNGATTLTGGAGQGIHGNLAGQGSLSYSSGSSVVNSGTVRSGTPTATIKVTVNSAFTTAISPFSNPAVVIPTDTSPQIDANAMQAMANFAFTGVDASGNPIVVVKNVNGIANGTYFLAKYSSGNAQANNLCTSVSGTACTSTPVARICGVSGSPNSSCFAYANSKWTISGTMLPSVVWFKGDLIFGGGPFVNTFLATGNITNSGQDVYAPNFVGSATACNGAAYTPPASTGGANVAALSTLLLSATNYATQLCTGSSPALTGATLGNIVLLAGSYTGSTFSGGLVTTSGGAVVLGTVMAGDVINNSGSSMMGGSIFTGRQSGNSSAKNVQSGSTTVGIGGGSSSFNPAVPGCVSNCPVPAPTNNIVWVSPV